MSADTMTPHLTDAAFIRALDRFREGVKSISGVEFEGLDRGFPADEEGYKEWVYLEGRRRLDYQSWSEESIGKGDILAAVIDAIEIDGREGYRNNLVQWDRRFGPKGRSHQQMLAARDNIEDRTTIEQALYLIYTKGEDGASYFDTLVQAVGQRYDLMAYLFFLKDWNRYMPTRPGRFMQAFDLLEMPHSMSGRCSWENYQGYLARLDLVRQKLVEHQVRGNRLLDAHSFCWMLVSLSTSKERETHPTYIAAIPEVARQTRSSADRDHPAPEIPAEDYIKKALENQEIGARAQGYILQEEKKRLQKAGRPDLADSVQDVSHKPALGYDIESFYNDGAKKRIEVKAAARRNKIWRFFLSQNELEKSKHVEGYVFALVGKVNSSKPVIWEFPSSKLPEDALHPKAYKVELRQA